MSSLSHMLDAHSVDVALITEHTPLTRSESFFTSIHSNYKTILTTDSSIDQYSSIRCGKAGTVIMIKRDAHYIFQQVVNILNERICGIQMQTVWITIIYFVCKYDLWLLRKNTDSKSTVCTALTVNDVCYSNENVISGFSNYFKVIFSTTVVENAVKKHVARMQLHDNPTSTGLTQPFTVEEIAKSLQKRKSPGHDNLVSEHILNALQPVNKALAMLFNSIL